MRPRFGSVTHGRGAAILAVTVESRPSRPSDILGRAVAAAAHRLIASAEELALIGGIDISLSFEVIGQNRAIVRANTPDGTQDQITSAARLLDRAIAIEQEIAK